MQQIEIECNHGAAQMAGGIASMEDAKKFFDPTWIACQRCMNCVCTGRREDCLNPSACEKSKKPCLN